MKIAFINVFYLDIESLGKFILSLLVICYFTFVCHYEDLVDKCFVTNYKKNNGRKGTPHNKIFI